MILETVCAFFYFVARLTTITSIACRTATRFAILTDSDATVIAFSDIFIRAVRKDACHAVMQMKIARGAIATTIEEFLAGGANSFSFPAQHVFIQTVFEVTFMKVFVATLTLFASKSLILDNTIDAAAQTMRPRLSLSPATFHCHLKMLTKTWNPYDMLDITRTTKERNDVVQKYFRSDQKDGRVGCSILRRLFRA
jgi:hypothetical protein